MNEQKVISHAQYWYLIYSQYDTLYEKILDAPRLSNIVPPTLGEESHAIDGIIGSASSQKVRKPSSATLATSSQNYSSNPTVTSSFEVNFVSSDEENINRN